MLLVYPSIQAGAHHTVLLAAGQMLEKEKLVDLVAGPDAYRDLPRLIAGVQVGHCEQFLLQDDNWLVMVTAAVLVAALLLADRQTGRRVPCYEM